MSEVSDKISIEFDLCKKIIKNQTDIINELNMILKQENGYKYNSKQKKLKKHFPASVNMNYNDYTTYLIKEQSKNSKVSFSLSSKTIIEQLDNFLFIAKMRSNTFNIFKNNDGLIEYLIVKNLYNIGLVSPLDLRNNLIKYDNTNDIKYRFPYFFDKGRAFYDVIYIVKTENPHFYIDSNNKTLSDTILICCNNKIFNIMFELDKNKPYYINLTNNYCESTMKKMYNDVDI